MAPRDEDVVLELLGMWYQKGKMKEVIQICDRLLERDPDNNVVKLFRAKAADNEKLRHVFASLKNYFAKQEIGVLAQKKGAATRPPLEISDEKMILEVMDKWFGEGKYDQVLSVANRLFERNPNSEGARILLQKSMDKEKLESIFSTLGKLFQE